MLEWGTVAESGGASEREPSQIPGLPMADKRRVRITPDWLDCMVPPMWFEVAERLAAMAADSKVPAARMRLFIQAASAIPNLPLVEGVRMMISGEIKLTAHTQADTATEPANGPGSGLILPPGIERI